MPITIKNLNFTLNTLDQPLFQDVNMTIDSSWCLGLIGRNGRGKTTLLRLIMNDYSYTGEIMSDKQFIYFPQSIKNKQALTYYAIDEVMPVELWKVERECQLLSLNPDILF